MIANLASGTVKAYQLSGCQLKLLTNGFDPPQILIFYFKLKNHRNNS